MHRRGGRSRPQTVMGADVAAGPHCPFAGTWPGRRGVPHRAVSRDGASNRGFQAPLPPGSFSGRSRSRFPRGLPDQGRSPGGSPFGGSELTSLFPPSRSRGRSFGSVDGGILRPKPPVRLTAMDRSPGPVAFAAPGPKPGPARPIRRRSAFLAGGGAKDRSPAFRRAGPGPEGPVSGLEGFRSARRPTGTLMGASRSLPPSHPLKGKPAASASRRLRQPPCLRFHPPDRPKTARLNSARAVAGKAFPRCREIVSATPESCHEKRVGPSPLCLWITRITGVNPGRSARPLASCPAPHGRIKEAPIFPS